MSNLKFDEVGKTSSGLTKIWAVSSTHSFVKLGEIKWYAVWRRYIYQPAGPTVYDAACLDEISAFLKEQMRLRG